MRDVQRSQGEAGISAANGKRYYRIEETLEELAARLVGEVADSETDDLMELTQGIWTR